MKDCRSPWLFLAVACTADAALLHSLAQACSGTLDKRLGRCQPCWLYAASAQIQIDGTCNCNGEAKINSLLGLPAVETSSEEDCNLAGAIHIKNEPCSDQDLVLDLAGHRVDSHAPII